MQASALASIRRGYSTTVAGPTSEAWIAIALGLGAVKVVRIYLFHFIIS